MFHSWEKQALDLNSAQLWRGLYTINHNYGLIIVVLIYVWVYFFRKNVDSQQPRALPSFFQESISKTLEFKYTDKGNDDYGWHWRFHFSAIEIQRKAEYHTWWWNWEGELWLSFLRAIKFEIRSNANWMSSDSEKAVPLLQKKVVLGTHLVIVRIDCWTENKSRMVLRIYRKIFNQKTKNQSQLETHNFQ